MENLEELRDLKGKGIAEVRTSSGLLVDLDTCGIEAAPPVVPQPHPPMDTAATDPVPGTNFYPPRMGEPPPQVESAQVSGGGMTEEAIAEDMKNKESQHLPPMPEEVLAAEAEPPPVEEIANDEEMAAAFNGEEEPDIEQEKLPTAKPKKSRRR